MRASRDAGFGLAERLIGGWCFPSFREKAGKDGKAGLVGRNSGTRELVEKLAVGGDERERQGHLAEGVG